MDPPKGMETMAVTKRYRTSNGKKKAVYQAEIWVKGVRVESKQFETQAHAYVWHDETKRKYEESPARGAYQVKPMNFRTCLQQYALSNDFIRLRLSSQQTRTVRFRHFENSPLSEIKMSDFSAEHVDDWLIWLKKSDTAFNPRRKSFNHELRLLTIILNWYRNELYPGFVIPVVRRHRERIHFKEVAPRRADYFIQTNDIQLWLQTLEKSNLKVYFHLAQFLVLTGARLGEATGLRWDSIDLDQKHATIRRTLAWDHHTRAPYIQEKAKNVESIRLLRLAPMLVEMLSEMKRNSRSPIVFCNQQNDYLRDNRIRSAFNRAFKALGMPWTSTRILRHTFATWALMASESDISAVQVAMGHKRRTTTEIYAKPMAALTGEVVDKGAEMMMRPRHVLNHVQGELMH
ncbi:MAG: site-specific integrase [Proteobacteria bacterium]|nr:MAG: site-specific integrase [Pseudomonadota bacterium]